MKSKKGYLINTQTLKLFLIVGAILFLAYFITDYNIFDEENKTLKIEISEQCVNLFVMDYCNIIKDSDYDKEKSVFSFAGNYEFYCFGLEDKQIVSVEDARSFC